MSLVELVRVRLLMEVVVVAVPNRVATPSISMTLTSRTVTPTLTAIEF